MDEFIELNYYAPSSSLIAVEQKYNWGNFHGSYLQILQTPQQ